MDRREFFADSNILMGHVRQQSPTIFDAALRDYGIPFISAIVIYEFEVGEVERGRKDVYYDHFDFLPIIEINHEIAHAAAILHNQLVKINQRVYVNDTIIAATALVYGLPLLTTNLKHFERVPGLDLLPLPPRQLG